VSVVCGKLTELDGHLLPPKLGPLTIVLCHAAQVLLFLIAQHKGPLLAYSLRHSCISADLSLSSSLPLRVVKVTS
jgi:hypothetical protein